MSLAAPHFLLYAEAAQGADSAVCDAGRWRFVLRLPNGETSLEATDEEQEASPERLELLAVIRGLEALGQPSRVTLLSGSRAIRRGLEHGLSNWRENDWQWERYGSLAPVKNGDLWKRLDRLLQYHAVECRPTRLDKADDLAQPREPSEPIRLKRSGRVVRIDTAHSAAKHQGLPLRGGARNRTSPTISDFKFKKAKKRSPSLSLWKSVVSSLLAAGNSVLGYLRVTSK